MPIYEYQCQQCGGTFEYQQRMSEDPKTVCETCGGKLERLISRTAFTLKGGGWYKDLYSSPKPDTRSEGEKKAAAKAGESGGAGGGGESKPAESKPAPMTATPTKKGGGD
ncbi:MAG TPA: zinc ribbon domain-containing protein [Kofleriaceae bacterium]|nr:zinc ribbon domain-containing protein [Kofleriaceae bacterium]